MNKYVFGQQRQQAQERQAALDEARRAISAQELDPRTLERTLSTQELQQIVQQLVQRIRILEMEREAARI